MASTLKRLLTGALALCCLASSAAAGSHLRSDNILEARLGGERLVLTPHAAKVWSSLSITTSLFTSITDVPVTSFVDGWTADLTMTAFAASTANNVLASAWPSYSRQTGLPNFTSPAVQIAVNSPGYTSTGSLATLGRTVYGVAPLRQTYPNSTLGFASQVGSAITTPIVLSDLIFSGDTLSSASVGGVYQNTLSALNSAGPAAATNNSTKAYPPPICSWVTEPGQTYDGTQPVSVEIFCAHLYGANGAPVAAVNISMNDGTNVKSYFATLAQSTRQFSTGCTATAGSNVLTNCGNVAGLKVGQRLTVASTTAGNGAIPGQPLIGAIDTTATANCLSGQVPCIELFAQQAATFNSDGSLSIASSAVAPLASGAPNPAGNAMADGGFAGQTITALTAVGGSVDTTWGTSGVATIVAPSVVCTLSTTCPISVGSGTPGTGKIYLPAPSQGQWKVGGFVYDSASTPCIYTDALNSKSEYLYATTSPTYNFTLYWGNTGGTSSVAANCGGHTLTGLAIAANPIGLTVASIFVSTSANAGAGGGATVAQFNHNYKGTGGAVTVTAGVPFPVYRVTFTAADVAAMNTGSMWFRAKAYPNIGNTSAVLDTQTPNWSAANAQCDAFYWFVNGGVCNSSNAFWFNPSGLNGSNVPQVSPNLHNLWAYHDPSGSQSYAPRYVWISPTGSVTVAGGCHVYSTGADPGSANYYAASSIAAAITDAKSYNNNTLSACSGYASARASAHNDHGGIVFCLVAGSSSPNSYTSVGAVVFGAGKPGVTYTSAVAGGTCPAPGQLGGAPALANIANANTSFAANANVRLQNLAILGSSTVINIGGPDTFSGLSLAMPTSELVVDNVIVQIASTMTSYNFYKWGGVYAYNTIVTEGNATSGLLSGASAYNTTPAAVIGSTISGPASTTSAGQWQPYTDLGNIAWNETLFNVTQDPGLSGVTNTSNLNWGLSQVVAYNKFMGINATFKPSSYYVENNNQAFINNVTETINAATSNNWSWIYAADNYVSPARNIAEMYNTVTGTRIAHNYVEGFVTTLGNSSAYTGTSLTATLTYGQAAWGAVGATAPTSTDLNTSGQPSSITPTAGNSIVFNGAGNGSGMPCDFSKIVWLYLDTALPPQHLADLASFTVNSASGTSLTVSAGMIGQLSVGARIANSSGVALLDTLGHELHIASCPAAGCASTGGTNTYTLTGTPASTLTGSLLGQAAGVRLCQPLYAIAKDPATNAAPVENSSFPGRNYSRTLWSAKYNIWYGMNTKSDYSAVLGAANGGRIGNWEMRYGVGLAGNVFESSPFALTYFDPQGQGGEVVPLDTWYYNDPVATAQNMSAVRYATGDDRSTGGAYYNGPLVTAYPGLNIGEGDCRPMAASVQNNKAAMAGRVRAGAAAMPFDMLGWPRNNSGAGWAGAFEASAF